MVENAAIDGVPPIPRPARFERHCERIRRFCQTVPARECPDIHILVQRQHIFLATEFTLSAIGKPQKAEWTGRMNRMILHQLVQLLEGLFGVISMNESRTDHHGSGNSAQEGFARQGNIHEGPGRKELNMLFIVSIILFSKFVIILVWHDAFILYLLTSITVTMASTFMTTPSEEGSSSLFLSAPDFRRGRFLAAGLESSSSMSSSSSSLAACSIIFSTLFSAALRGGRLAGSLVSSSSSLGMIASSLFGCMATTMATAMVSNSKLYSEIMMLQSPPLKIKSGSVF